MTMKLNDIEAIFADKCQCPDGLADGHYEGGEICLACEVWREIVMLMVLVLSTEPCVLGHKVFGTVLRPDGWLPNSFSRTVRRVPCSELLTWTSPSPEPP